MSQNIVDYCIGLDLGTGSVGWAVVDICGDLDYSVMQKQQQQEDLADLYVEDTIKEGKELDY